MSTFSTKDHIQRYYITPQFHFTFFGFDWVKPWPGDGMILHFQVMGALAVCIMLGIWYRVAAPLFFLAFTHVFLAEQAQYLNHFYLVCLVSLLLIFLPAHRAFSLDAWRNPNLRTLSVPGWTLWALRVQIGIPYFFGGIAKISGDWLRGEPMRTWLRDRTDFPVIGKYFEQEWAPYFFAYSGLLLDLLVVPALLWKPTRLPALVVALAFHLTNARLFSIGIFPWFMICATFIFFPHDAPRRLWKWLRGRPPAASAEVQSGAPVPVRVWSARQSLTASLLAVFFGFQFLMPFRHLIYPGNVDWTEEGHNFSWHMKLRSKDADAVFLVTDLATGHVTEVFPQEYLSGRQVGKMSTRPDMILQFTHFLVEKLREQGMPAVEIRAVVNASLNGRRPQPLVDPTVDLAKEERSILPYRWIVPLREPLRRSDTREARQNPLIPRDD